MFSSFYNSVKGIFLFFILVTIIYSFYYVFLQISGGKEFSSIFIIQIYNKWYLYKNKETKFIEIVYVDKKSKKIKLRKV